jgi:MoaA/NifB/PqqE/SkfB family radical SAM enzyme
MPLDTLGRIFGSLRKLGVRIVSLTGGEPLMRNDLAEVIHLAKCYGLLPHVCTNGIALTRERAAELVKAGVYSIILSLDTLDPEIYEKHRGVSFRFAEQALASLAYIVNEHPQICGAVNCVITSYNIGKLVSFVKKISELGKGKIFVNLQPYHSPPTFAEISQGLNQEMISKLKVYYQDMLPENGLIPNHELKPILEKEIEELIQLKKGKVSLNNSEFYLRRISNFLFDNKLPNDFRCLAGFTGIVIRYDLKVLPCWRLPPVGDLQREELVDIWFSQRYRKKRAAMKRLRCPMCILLCHNEPGWYEWYNSIYKSFK